MSDRILLIFDPSANVLYVKREGARVIASTSSPSDGCLILNKDERGRIVGVQVLSADSLAPPEWLSHPDRPLVPDEIFAKVGAWIEHHGSS